MCEDRRDHSLRTVVDTSSTLSFAREQSPIDTAIDADCIGRTRPCIPTSVLYTDCQRPNILLGDRRVADVRDRLDVYRLRVVRGHLHARKVA